MRRAHRGAAARARHRVRALREGARHGRTSIARHAGRERRAAARALRPRRRRHDRRPAMDAPALRRRARRRLRLGTRRARHEGRRRDVHRGVRRGARGRLADAAASLDPERRGERRRRGREVPRRGASPTRFAGAKHALGEFGGATQWIAGKRFYPIQVAEKQLCWLRAHVRGTGGHGALGVKGGAMRKLGDVLRTLDRAPAAGAHHPARPRLVRADGSRAAAPAGALLRRLLDPKTADLAARALGPRGRQLSRVIRNTVSPTIVHGGGQDQRHPERDRARSSTGGCCRASRPRT